MPAETNESIDFEAETVRFYGECVDAYLQGAPYGIRPHIEWTLVELLRDAGPNALLLDIGCANGRLAGYAVGLGAKRYLGVDAAESLLEMARRDYPYPDTEFRQANILSLSQVLTVKADVCVSCYTLSHISRAKIDTALTEIRAVMKSGATGLFEFVYGDEEVLASKEEMPHLPEGYRVGLAAWNPESLTPHFITCGFEVLEEPHLENYVLTYTVKAR
jgi:cyclopropane fatty-acyl-phospholipid synthase-like methyltransferase